MQTAFYCWEQEQHLWTIRAILPVSTKYRRTKMLTTLRKPLLALFLGVLPYVAFVGATSSTRINGRLVQQDEVNLFGLALAAAGLVVVWRYMRTPTGRSSVANVVAVVSVIACLVQIPVSAGVVSPVRLIAGLNADSDLPQLTYQGLDAGNRRIPEGILAKGDPAETRRQIIGYKASVFAYASTHLAYADRCHNGRRRIAPAVVEAVPDFATEVDRASLAQEAAAGRARGEALACNEANTRHAMGDLVDRVSRLGDFITILEQGLSTQLNTNG